MSDSLPLALGTMHLGTRLDEAASFALLDRFVEHGGTWIDTADCYAFWQGGTGAGGQSEQTIGRWLRSRPGVRDQVRIGTKVGAEPRVPGHPEIRQGLSAPVIRAGMEGSLRRLGLEAVDLYWAHLQDRSVPVEEWVGALGDLARAGTAGRIGVSNHPAWLVERAQHLLAAAGAPRLTAVQQRSSYLHPRPDVAVEGQEHEFGMMSAETLDHVRANPDVEAWAYTTLLLGAYDRDDRSPGEAYDHTGTARRLAALASVADDLGVARSQVVLAWLVGGDVPVRPIVGGSSTQQLDSAVAGARLVLDPEHRARLDAAG